MKYIKMFRMLSLAVILSLFIIVLPAVPALAQTEALSLDPTEGGTGQTIAVSATDFTPSISVHFYFSSDLADVGDVIGTAPVNTYKRVKPSVSTTIDGDFTTTFTVPTTLTEGTDDESVTEGDYYVYATTSTSPYTILAVADFTVITQATITLDPTTGAIGDTISIDGSDFNDVTVYIYLSSDLASVGETIGTGGDVTVYHRVKTVTSVSSSGAFSNQTFPVPTALTTGSPDEDVAAGNYYIYATYSSNGGTILAVADFTVESAADITLSPTSGAIGQTVTITGDGFNPSVTVYIYFSSDSAIVDDAIDSDVTVYKRVLSFSTNSSGAFGTGRTFAVPSVLDTQGNETVTQGNYYVYAAHSNDTILARASFTVSAATITLSPTEGAVGDTVTVQGTGFPASSAIALEFDDVSISIQSGSTTTSTSGGFSSTIKIPDSIAGTHKIDAIVSSREAKADFKVKPKVVMTPTSGAQDSSVSVVGTGYGSAKEVTILFNNTSVKTATTDAKGGFTTTFTVPKLAAGSYNVDFKETATPTNIVTLKYTVTAPAPPPTPTPTPTPSANINMNPTKGFIGSEVVVGGVGFKEGATISVKWDDKEVASVKGGTQGIFIATFKVPAGKSGDHAVTVTDGTKTEKLTFKVEATVPDIPAPLAPAMGVEVEKTLTFDWKDVTSDNTPVTYVLQVATSQEFTPASVVLEKKGLTKSEYMPTKEEAAKLAGRDTPYYWRIRAVDAGENESNWTGVGQFYVPKPFSLPDWAKWLAIGVGALVLLFIGYWVGRRSAYSY